MESNQDRNRDDFLLTRKVTLEDIMETKQDRNRDDYGNKSTAAVLQH
jgi:hypothetical protein